jgi:hypothetical protein
VGTENWEYRGGGSQMAFQTVDPLSQTAPARRTTALDRNLPTNVSDPPVVVNVNHIRYKNPGGSWPSGGPLYKPHTLNGYVWHARTAARRWSLFRGSIGCWDRTGTGMKIALSRKSAASHPSRQLSTRKPPRNPCTFSRTDPLTPSLSPPGHPSSPSTAVRAENEPLQDDV